MKEDAGGPLAEDDTDSSHLGQFIPLHYHHNMLMNADRMNGFKAAIDHTVVEGDKVLELGSGTGILSYLAAAQADQVWSVELNPELVLESRRLLALNSNVHKIDVIHADAFTYLPPEPVDVVICEMLHAALLREKQVELIESFKERYLARFGGPLPVFLPEAVIMAVQPVQENYHFFDFYAPIIKFQRPPLTPDGPKALAAPMVYSVVDFSQPNSGEIHWQGALTIEDKGTVNALGFITKSILAIDEEGASSIDWFLDYLTLPLHKPVEVEAGDTLEVSFHYRTGGSLRSLERNIRVTVI